MRTHGTAPMYRRGCRCEACATALPHGAISGYTGWACRCPACRLAMADYRRRLRAAYAADPPGDIPHGTLGGYQNYACRCDACRAATAERRARSAAGQ